MSHRRLRPSGALGLVLLFGCGEHGGPQAPESPSLDWQGSPPGAPLAAPQSDAGSPIQIAFPPDFAALPLAQVASSALTPASPLLATPYLPLLQAARPLPPISGGTLAAGANGIVVASDPDRDLIYIVDPAADRVDTLTLATGAEPGRVAIEGERAFVALRATGTLLTLDLRQRRESARLSVCAAPRGVSFDGAEERVLVACAGGDVVAIAPDGTRVLARGRVAPDLRDVGRDARGVWVSQYRSAKLFRLDAALQRVEEQQAARAAGVQPQSSSAAQHFKEFTPTLAWRTVAGPGGEPFMLHQRAQTSMVGSQTTMTSAYGSSTGSASSFCEGGILHSTISRFGGETAEPRAALPQAVVPVDLSLAPSGQRLAAVAPGNFLRQGVPAFGSGPPQQLYLIKADQLVAASDTLGQRQTDCIVDVNGWQQLFPGEATAVQFLDEDTLLVQLRNPAELDVLHIDAGGVPRLAKVISLSPIAVRDTGHEVFHQNTGTGIACASCHGEALDDGHVWTFALFGVRRTQHLRGGVLQSAPFHWVGDLANFQALIDDVYLRRMSGQPLELGSVEVMSHWLDSLALIPSEAGDAERVARGRVLFESSEVGCGTCHAGASLRSAGAFDVGTGGTFEVPSLRGISLRLPLLHNGCADTLEERFDPACGGSKHGATAQLDDAQLADLIAYLASL